ncbi:UNVERIFIED_ORG: hypothetical protein ABIC54_004587 [Burkholderia sp. 1263]
MPQSPAKEETLEAQMKWLEERRALAWSRTGSSRSLT